MPSDRFSRLHHRQINCHYCDELLLIAVASYYGVGKKCKKCGNVNHPYDRDDDWIMPSPVSPCPNYPKCKRMMDYESHLSNKKKGRRTFSCIDCGHYVIEDRVSTRLKNKHDKSVGLPVTAINRLIIDGKDDLIYN